MKLNITNENDGSKVDQWACSLAWLPVLLINTAGAARSGAAATENLTNEMVRRADASAAMQQRLAAHSYLKLIEGNSE